MRQPEHEAGQDHEGTIIDGAFVVAGGERAELLQAADAALDDIAPTIRLMVEGRLASRVVRPSFTLVPALRNSVPNAPATQHASGTQVAVALVGKQPDGSPAHRSRPTWFRHA